jgi:ATP-binding cassette subfamily F protein uup
LLSIRRAHVQILGYLLPHVIEPAILGVSDSQKVPDSVFGTVFSVISSGAGKKGQLVQEYHKLAGMLADCGDSELLRKLDNVQHRLEAENAWDLHNQAEKLISDLGLDGEAEFSTLSAGLKRRTLLGRALVVEPDLLMLDEPTNHLDIESIAFLENFLLNYGATLLFVTHDRTFLRKLSTRIITIDNGKLSSWGCDYDTYLKRKDIQMQAMAKEHGQFDKKLSSEEAWIRKGIKARRTRNEGRVRALEKMREMRRQRRIATGKVRFAVQDTQLSGRLVIEAKNVCFSYGPESGEENVISDFSNTIFRGDKIGIIGPNGCGKSTLLGALLKKLIINGMTAKGENSVFTGLTLEGDGQFNKLFGGFGLEKEGPESNTEGIAKLDEVKLHQNNKGGTADNDEK